VQGSLRVAGVNRAAQAAAIVPGLMLTDARAVVPDLEVRSADPEGDARALAALADWCGRYTPWAAAEESREGHHGLWLDVTGCAHLFGGEGELLDDLVGRLARLGFAARVAVADTPGAAWAVARLGAPQPPRGEAEPGARTALVVAPGKQREALAGLPVTGLRLPEDSVAELECLGLSRIGDLYALPRAPLAARFGAFLPSRLDQALGREREPLSPRRPVPSYRARLAFAEPIVTMSDIEAALGCVLETLCRDLAHGHTGARQLEFALYLVDGRVQRRRIGTSYPSRDAGHLMKLFADRLSGLELGYGVDVMTLAALITEPLAAAQLDFGDEDAEFRSACIDHATDDESDAELGCLVDRLGNRLGAANVVRLEPRASYLPERSVVIRPPMAPPTTSRSAAWPAVWPRPVCLFFRPEPVEVVAPLPDDPPVLFRWRQSLHRVARADGPERIAPEWWREVAAEAGGAACRAALIRDYYRIEDRAGRRFWLFREGLYAPAGAAPAPRWYLHGLFA